MRRVPGARRITVGRIRTNEYCSFSTLSVSLCLLRADQENLIALHLIDIVSQRSCDAGLLVE
jgi:hypothetical protein